jgi:hypothetical protein
MVGESIRCGEGRLETRPSDPPLGDVGRQGELDVAGRAGELDVAGRAGKSQLTSHSKLPDVGVLCLSKRRLPRPAIRSWKLCFPSAFVLPVGP